ncbi:MAG: hypothetical protein ABR577_09030 [Pyrinomonadaceae bacterium]
MKNLRAALTGLFIVLLVAASAACVNQPFGNDAAKNGGGRAEAKGELRLTPPYSTKEPDKYRATIITTASLDEQATKDAAAQGTTEQRVVVARDGEKRRVDYELPPNKKISLLQLPAGDLLLDPAKKLYAEVEEGAGVAASLQEKKTSRGFSPDALPDKSRAAARYENLGAEAVNNRAATKYRVTVTGITGETRETATVSLIWIDDALQMPVKQEIVSQGNMEAGRHGARWAMELRDISQDVPAELFEVPQGYQKAPLQAILPQASNAPHR